MAKFNMKALALAFGISWAFYVAFVAWVAGLFPSIGTNGWGGAIVVGLSSLYLGYKATFLGGLIGAVWGFVDGAICGIIVAWLYNMFAKE